MNGETRDRFVVGGAAHRTIRSRDGTAVNERASLRVELRQVVAHTDGLGLAICTHTFHEPGLIPGVHQTVFAVAFPFAIFRLVSFLGVFSFRFSALWRWRPFSLPSSSLGRCRGGDWFGAWLQHRNHVVPDCRAFVQRIVEVPVFFVDELVDFLHQKTVSRHEFSQIPGTGSAVRRVLLSAGTTASMRGGFRVSKSLVRRVPNTAGQECCLSRAIPTDSLLGMLSADP